MASDKDKLFEKIYFLWKGEGEKRNQSIDWYCEHYGAKVEEFRKWFQGINKSVKEILVISRPRQPQEPETHTPESAEEVMSRLREQQESEARIVITTSDIVKKQKLAIVSLTINLGNSLHITHKGVVLLGVPHLCLKFAVLCQTLPYPQRFFQEIIKGHTDYANLLPMTTGRINLN